jgi:hypothetical protein
VAVEGDGAAVDFDAAFDDDEAEAEAGGFADIATAAEDFEEAGLVFGRDADAVVADGQDGFMSDDGDGEGNWGFGGGILDGIGEEIAEDVTEEGFVGVGGRGGIEGDDIDGAAESGSLLDFVGETAAEGLEIERTGLEGETTGLDATEEKDFVDEASHVMGGVDDILEVIVSALGGEAVEVGIEDLG